MCGTHPFPSQGSLAGLELLAAQGSMGPNGSINNSVYVNPFDPSREGRGFGEGGGERNSKKAVTLSPRGSPQRRVRIAARSRSSDLADLDLMDREMFMVDVGPKYQRARISQGGQGPRGGFVGGLTEGGARRGPRRQATMSTKIAAALNQGISSLGGKLGTTKDGSSPPPPVQSVSAPPIAPPPSLPGPDTRQKSILKTCESVTKDSDCETERLLASDEASVSISATPFPSRRCVSVNTQPQTHLQEGEDREYDVLASPGTKYERREGERSDPCSQDDSGIGCSTSLEILSMTLGAGGTYLCATPSAGRKVDSVAKSVVPVTASLRGPTS